MDKKEKKSLPEPRTYTVEQIAAMLNISSNYFNTVLLFEQGYKLYLR